MTRDEINVALCALLETLDQTAEGAPSGVLYAAMLSAHNGRSSRFSVGDFGGILHLARAGELVTCEGEIVRITPRGAEMAQKIRDHRAA